MPVIALLKSSPARKLPLVVSTGLHLIGARTVSATDQEAPYGTLW